MRRAFLAAVTAAVLCLATNAFAQQSAPVQKSAPAKPKGKRSEAVPDEGAITAGIYSEKFFYLRYPIPQGWVVKTTEMRQGLPASANSILLLSAFAKNGPEAGEINPSVTITAESVAGNPDVKTPDDYLQSVTQLVASKGFTVLNPPGEITIGGVDFLRSDFERQEGETSTYQATMVALRRGYLLQITAISGKVEDLTALLNRIQIIAPPTMKKQ